MRVPRKRARKAVPPASTVVPCALEERLQGSTQWDEWDATLDVVPLLGGLANVDRFRTELNGDYFEGVSLRIFGPETDHWAIYWMDTHDPRPRLQVTGHLSFAT